MAQHTDDGFTAAERAAMKARARELKAEAKAKTRREAGEREVLAAIAAMPDADRALGEAVHALVTSVAPALVPKLWYGQPAYAKDGQVICFFHSASKYDTRYATFGFGDGADVGEGTMWPTAFALTDLGERDKAMLGALIRRAAGS